MISLINELGEYLMKKYKMMNLCSKNVSVDADREYTEYTEGIWKMVQLITCLLRKHDYLNLNLLHAHDRSRSMHVLSQLARPGVQRQEAET